DATVTALSDGGYRVTWAALGQDGSGLGIYSQRYDADGNASVLAGDGSANTLTWSGTTRMVLDGRAGNDSLNGSFSSDTLEGGAGNDVLSGGLGHDTALFGGVLSGYTIVKSDTQFTVTDTNVANGDDGIDTLFYVERLQFADAEVGLAIPPSMGVGDPEYPANWLDYYTVADFNGDGKTDLWWKTKAGVVGVWTTDAASVWQGDAMRDVFHDWSTVDQNGDGIAEIARQHLANGASIQWSDASAEITAGQLGLDHGWAMF
ncbi:MAG: hypothetical protein HZA62_00190, partial [Rhodocyclales bacterium]|nr:hypothetical protein [Rhodocyclales bacterium]